MSRRYSIGAGLVEMTGSIVETAGIPGVNLATGLLASLIKACEEVGDNEVRCLRIRNTCMLIMVNVTVTRTDVENSVVDAESFLTSSTIATWIAREARNLET